MPIILGWDATNPAGFTMTPVSAIGLGIALAIASSLCCQGDIAPGAVVQDSLAPAGEIRAFPGAEGFGATALRACSRQRPHVFVVTNRNDSGSGSLRRAMANAESAPDDELKVIVFRTGGYIELSSDITFTGNCLYIAGQTAPRDGITLRGRGLEFERGARDIVIRYIRIRLGGARDGILVRDGSNYIFDHLSVSWTGRTLIRFSRTQVPRSGPTANVTVQRSLLAESLSSHPTGLQIGGQPDTDENGTQAGLRDQTNYSIHSNAFVSNHHRNINARGIGIEIVNNVIHNWRLDGGQTGGGALVDWVNNYFQKGPMSRGSYRPIGVRTRDVTESPFDRPSLYVSGNLSVGGSHHSDQNTSATASNWQDSTRLVDWYHADDGQGFDVRAFRRHERLELPDVPVAVRTASDALASVLNDVGANRGLDCAGRWFWRMDAVDQRLIQEIRNGTGPSSTPENPGAFPDLAHGTECSDANEDGIPDEWKIARGLDPTGESVASRIGAGGYSYLEHYLNGTTP